MQQSACEDAVDDFLLDDLGGVELPGQRLDFPAKARRWL
jgi:hypothetical protein